MNMKWKQHAGIAFLSALALAAPVQASDQDVARDKRGGVVVDSRGNCVHTRWDAQSSNCFYGGSEAGTVYFNFDDVDLTAEARTKLKNLAESLKNARDIESVHVVGYADMMGEDTYNADLSSRRANAVRGYLSSLGVKNAREVMVRGLGSSNSVTDCDTGMSREAKIQCLAADRRVEVQVSYK